MERDSEREHKRRMREKIKDRLKDDEYKRKVTKELLKERKPKGKIKKQSLIKKYGKLSVEDIVFKDDLDEAEQILLLGGVYGYDEEEAEILIDSAKSEETKAKLSKVRRKIAQKAREKFSDIPSDDERQPIPDDIKMFVWQRDRGQCVTCGSKENLEFDHIIPFAKGGSNTARNLQLLCESCNRSKSDQI